MTLCVFFRVRGGLSKQSMCFVGALLLLFLHFLSFWVWWGGGRRGGDLRHNDAGADADD